MMPSMNPETSEPSVFDESRTARVIRALTWIGILAGALFFWALAGWTVVAYFRP